MVLENNDLVWDQDAALIGIDLGTTFSLIACIDEHGKPVILNNAENHPLTPSAVLLEREEKDGEINVIVGEQARDAVAYPERVVTLAKRHMGEEGFAFERMGERYRPEEISAFVLKKLKQYAETRLKEDMATRNVVKKAIITVPAYFGLAENKATQDAGVMAGLEVVELLPEPIATAFAYSDVSDRAKTMLVYDLGGGTFDITLFRMTPSIDGDPLPHVEMISTGGNRCLGGADWDSEIVNYVAEEFMRLCRERGVDVEDPRGDPTTNQELLLRSEKAKIQLSLRESAPVACMHAGCVETIQIDRKKLLELTGYLLQQTQDEIEQLLRAKGLSTNDIGEVLCAGGATRMKMVRDMLEEVFPGRVNTDIDPDLCVAKGAAIYASRRAGVHAHDNSGLSLGKPKTPHALGVAVINPQGGEVLIAPIIVKDQEMPCDIENDKFWTTGPGPCNVETPVFTTFGSSRATKWGGGRECSPFCLLIYESEDRDMYLCPVTSGRMVGQMIGIVPEGSRIALRFSLDLSYRLRACATLVQEGEDGREKRRGPVPIELRIGMMKEEVMRKTDEISKLVIF